MNHKVLDNTMKQHPVVGFLFDQFQEIISVLGPGGNYDDEIRSIMEKLIFLPGETVIYPGHGPQSTIARERTQNPFLEPFNEREELEELN